MSGCQKVLLAWSSGKDSAWSLRTLQRRGDIDVAGLLTTFNRDAGRVSMHAVREELVQMQACAVGLPLHKVKIPAECSNNQYEAAMDKVLSRAKAAGVTAVAFGDLFLEDVRRYREERLVAIGIEPLFPLWGLDTHALAREMVHAGLKAHITSVDTQQLDARFAGRTFDDEFLGDLPAAVDPCGERGEFHTFAYEGPMFAAPLAITGGEVMTRGQFVYVDVLPTS
jgi:uncharacterized protein (TIGR00290 family)